MKTQVNKATVDTAKETKINNNLKAEMNVVFKKKTLHDGKKSIIVFCEICSQ